MWFFSWFFSWFMMLVLKPPLMGKSPWNTQFFPPKAPRTAASVAAPSARAPAAPPAESATPRDPRGRHPGGSGRSPCWAWPGNHGKLWLCPPSDVNVGLDSPHEIYGYLHLVNHRIHQVTNQLSKGTGAPPCGNSWHSEVYTIFNVRWLT